jgi:hypothetical protein
MDLDESEWLGRTSRVGKDAWRLCRRDRLAYIGLCRSPAVLRPMLFFSFPRDRVQYMKHF